MARLSACILLCVIAGAALWGCSTPGGPEPDDDLECPLRTSPQGVVDRIEWAYEHRDLDAYLDCLAVDFIFFPCWAPPDLPNYWTRAEEDTIHRRMFGEGSGVDSISLALATVSMVPVPGPDPGDPPQWECEQSVNLRVCVGSLVYVVREPSMLRIRIDEDSVGPNGETLWETETWYDLEPEKLGREDTTWSALKMTFLDRGP
jgi:hypothetical protein